MLIEATLQDIPATAATTNGTRLTQTKSLAVAVTEPEGMDMTRAGKRYAIGRSAAVTGIASVVTQMTTAAQWALFNTSSSLCCWFDSLGAVLDSGVGGATGNAVYVCDFTLPAQTGYATGLSVQSMNGGSASSTIAIKSGVTITTPTAPFWYPIAFLSSGITPGILGTSVINNDLHGKLCLRPLHGLGIAVCGATSGTPLWGPAGSWVELVSNVT